MLNKQGWMFDIDVMLLIWKFKEVQYHQAHYQNLLHKMKLGKWVRLKTMQKLELSVTESAAWVSVIENSLFIIKLILLILQR